MNYLDETVTKSLDEFMEYYKMVDTEEIYSNGIEFVPIFRVKQWEEYNNKDKEIKRLKEEYVILQNASDEVEEKLQQRIDKAIEYINWVWNNTNKPTNTIVALRTLENILQGSDKE